MQLTITAVAVYRLASVEPWLLDLPLVSFRMHVDTKSASNPKFLQILFHTYLERNLNYFHIYTDGSKDLQSTAAAAVGKDRRFLSRLPAEASVFSAEATGNTLAVDELFVL